MQRFGELNKKYMCEEYKIQNIPSDYSLCWEIEMICDADFRGGLVLKRLRF